MLRKALDIDPLDHLALYENSRVEVTGEKANRIANVRFQDTIRDNPEAYLEIAADYVACGLWGEVSQLLTAAVDRSNDGLSNYPTIHYYLAYAQAMSGDEKSAQKWLRSAAACPRDYCFPFRLETLAVYDYAVKANPADASAWYYRGNLLFDLQPEAAMQCWERAIAHNPQMGLAHRNLGWGYRHHQRDIGRAIACYEKAIEVNPNDPVYYAELDTLMEQNNETVERRLAIFAGRHDVVKHYQQALLREVMVLLQAQQYDRAIGILDSSFFHAQEGNRQVHDVHVDLHLLQGLKCLAEDRNEEALAHFKRADDYPVNQQIIRSSDYEKNAEIYYQTAVCLAVQGDMSEAEAYLKRARSAVGENSALFYQGLTLEKLGDPKGARKKYDRLIELGTERMKDLDSVDFFAKFGDGGPEHRRIAEAHYLVGLGLLGKGDLEQAAQTLRKAIQYDVNHTWARFYLRQCDEQMSEF